MKKEVVVIGGGIVGFFCVYFMYKLGYKVCVIEKNDGVNGIFFGNVGFIFVFKKVLFLCFGVVLDILKFMFKN